MVISLLDISRLKITLVRLLWIDADATEVEGQRRLADRGTRGDDDHLAAGESVDQLVEVGETGRDATGGAVVAGDRLDLVEGVLHDRGQRRVVLLLPLLADRVDLLLGHVDGLVDVALAGVPHLRDLGAGVDQPAQDRLLAHDGGVVAGVGGDRDAGRERVEVRRPADLLQLAPTVELGRDRDRVGRLAAAVEVDDRVVDRLVGRPVEVGATDLLVDVGDRVLGDQHRAEHALLGVGVLRGHPARPVLLVAARRRRRSRARRRGRTSVQDSLMATPAEPDAPDSVTLIRWPSPCASSFRARQGRARTDTLPSAAERRPSGVPGW